MPLPGNVTTITVTGTYLDFQGFPQNGTVSFVPNTDPFTDSAATTILTGIPIVATLSTSGAFSVVVPTTDQAHLSPTPFAYNITENLSGGKRTYAVSIPSSLGSTVDISTLVPVNPTPPLATYYAVLANNNTFTGASNVFTGGVTVQNGLSLNSTALSLVSQISTAGSAGTGAAGAQAGGSPPTPVVTGNNTAGKVTFGTGTSPSAGSMAVVTLAASFGSAPRVYIVANNSATALLSPYILSTGVNSFTLSVASAPAASQANTTYSVNYFCVA